MKKLTNQLFSVLLAAAFLVSSCTLTVFSQSGDDYAGKGSDYSANADDSIVPRADDNLEIGLRATSELVATSDGYMRVFYDGSEIHIEDYDNDFQIISRRSIAMELSIWGGFYAGSDAYYVVEGQKNEAEDDAAEVIRVIKYDKNWNKMGAAQITGDSEVFGYDVRYPFDVGCVEFTEYNGTLYIVTGHEGYVDPNYNQGHQGFLMVAVNETTMDGQIVNADLWHSFAQYIDRKDSDLYVLELSEGSRCTQLSKYNADDISDSKSISVLEYGGNRTSAWAVSCYASVDGIAVSSDHVFGLGTSIDQSKYDTITQDDPHNIYLTVTPISDFSESATEVKWLTSYTGGGKSFLGTKITKINDDRFMVSWEEYEEYEEESQTAELDDTLSESILHYIFIDGSGETLTEEYTAAAPISDCQPIVKGSKIVYYASNGNMVNFYTIDSETGAFSKKAYRVAGENAVWNFDNGVLTISGTGAVSVDTEANFRSPLSSTSGGYVYSSSNNCWKPIRDAVEKIVVEDGITSISANAFNYFSGLTEVSIGTTVKSIGKEAFAFNSSLRKITIPASVTNIGEDILWTGYYWTYDESHVVAATIYGDPGSSAEEYAKENQIEFELRKQTPEVDKSALKELVEQYEAENLKEEDYEPDSWAAYTQALKDAKDVLAKEDAVQEDVTKACDVLRAAHAGLVKADTPLELPFEDVLNQSGYWYYDTVADVYRRGLMTGKSEKVFAPLENLARAQFAVILWRMEGEPEMTYESKFPDVPEGQFYTQAVLWAAENGIVSGYTSTNTFGPSDNITREQMAVMMYRYANYKKYDVTKSQELDSFPDAGQVQPFATEAVKWCTAMEIITGDGGKLNPQGNTNRAVCATIISRFVKAYE